MTIRFYQLVDRIAAALASSGWIIVDQPERPDRRPARLRVARPGPSRPGPSAGGTLTLLVYAWNATHGGNTRAGYEFRVQMTGVAPPLANEPGAHTLLLGLSPAEGVMTAWDPTYRRAFAEGSSSLQTRRDAIDTALATGWGFHRRENGEVAVSFLDEYVGTYVEAQAALHVMRSDAFPFVESEAGAVMQADDRQRVPLREPLPSAQAGETHDEDEPGRVVRLVRQVVRDQSFSRRVLSAYAATCCGCGTQLGLVEGAHIVPVAVRPIFSTRNGLALCANHHVAYDTGLFAVMPDFRIVVNENAVRILGERKLLGGTDLVLGTLDRAIRLPANDWERPATEYLNEAIEFRARISSFA
jgi:putative restriction endonuclease